MNCRRQIAIACMLSSGFFAGLWGCGGEPAASRKASLEELNPRDQTVTFWYQHTDEREAALLKLLEEFNRTNPHGIKVVVERYI